MPPIEYAVYREPGDRYEVAVKGLTKDEARTMLALVARQQSERSGDVLSPSEWEKITTVDNAGSKPWQ